MPAALDLTGHKYNRLTVIRQLPTEKYGVLRWLCRCDCGNTVETITSYLRHNEVKSCGCLREEVIRRSKNKTHGHTVNREHRTKTYTAWRSMKQRCLYKKDISYPNYGGKGVTIDSSWINSFETFLLDMGECPPNGSLDRIDNSKGYSRSNCRWTTITEQNRNKRNLRHITFKNETKLLVDWSRIYGINAVTLSGRLNRGWSTEDALLTPVGKNGKRNESL